MNEVIYCNYGLQKSKIENYYRQEKTSFFCMVKEDDTEYEIEVNQPHDKVYKIILGDKGEAANFISKSLNIEIGPKDIEKYTTHFITNNFRNKDTDVVYKLKDQKIFFLIEHQSSVDYAMPYRLLMYEMEIIKSAVDENKLHLSDYKIPTVYSIVLYTGKRKWNVKNDFNEMQEKLKGTSAITLTNYHLADINKMKNEELIEDKNLLSKVMLLDKSKTKDELEQNLNEITQRQMVDEKKNTLKKIIYFTLVKKIGIEKAKEYLKKLEKGDYKSMSMFEEYLEDLFDKGEEKGVQNTIEKIVKNMIKNNLADKQIMKIANISQEKLLEIKSKVLVKK